LLGIDLLDGTPVLDIKPYIPQYDYPAKPTLSLPVQSLDSERSSKHIEAEAMHEKATSVSNTVIGLPYCETIYTDITENFDETDFKKLSSTTNTLPEDSCSADSYQLTYTVNAEREPGTSIVSYADWVTNPPASALSVTFTPNAENQLLQFNKLPESSAFHHVQRLPDASHLRSAIVDILSADPRSAYRRKHCTDRLYYLTVDAAHVTCWFDGLTVEVLKIQASS